MLLWQHASQPIVGCPLWAGVQLLLHRRSRCHVRRERIHHHRLSRNRRVFILFLNVCFTLGRLLVTMMTSIAKNVSYFLNCPEPPSQFSVLDLWENQRGQQYIAQEAFTTSHRVYIRTIL